MKGPNGLLYQEWIVWMLIFWETIHSLSRKEEHKLESLVSATTGVRRREVNIHFRGQLDRRWKHLAQALHIGQYSHILG